MPSDRHAIACRQCGAVLGRINRGDRNARRGVATRIVTAAPGVRRSMIAAGHWLTGQPVETRGNALRPAAFFVWGFRLADTEIHPADLDMTPKAVEMFGAYLMLGPGRSLAKLNAGGTAAKLRQLETWSAKYGWQERIKRIAQKQIETANEKRLEIWLRTIGVYDAKTRQEAIDKLSLGDVHSIHDRVRPQEAGSVSVGVGAALTVTIGMRPDGPPEQ